MNHQSPQKKQKKEKKERKKREKKWITIEQSGSAFRMRGAEDPVLESDVALRPEIVVVRHDPRRARPGFGIMH